MPDGPPKPNLTAFQHEIKNLPRADKQKGKFRVDTLDPDMINGEDGAWWVDTDIISQGEMPPPDEEDVELADADRAKVVDWISQELLVASQSRRSEQHFVPPFDPLRNQLRPAGSSGVALRFRQGFASGNGIGGLE